MSTALDPNRLVIAVTGGTGLQASTHVLTTAARAGALALFDLAGGDTWALRAFAQAARRSPGLGVRVTAECAATPADLARLGGDSIGVVLLAAESRWTVAELAEK
jgi:hypothetical protein